MGIDKWPAALGADSTNADQRAQGVRLRRVELAKFAAHAKDFSEVTAFDLERAGRLTGPTPFSLPLASARRESARS